VAPAAIQAPAPRGSVVGAASADQPGLQAVIADRIGGVAAAGQVTGARAATWAPPQRGTGGARRTPHPRRV